MRYEVRLIGPDNIDGLTCLHGLMFATDDYTEAKQFAEAHCWDGERGTAIVDRKTGTVDIGLDDELDISRFRILKEEEVTP